MTTSTVSSLTQPTTEQRWHKIKTAYNETALSVLGRRKKRFLRGWISTERWRKIEERRTLKKTTDGARSERLKNKARREYREKGKEVMKSLRKDKRDWITSVARESEDAGQQGQVKRVYEAARS